MKKLMVIVFTLSGMVAQAKLSDQQSMKCIDGDRQTKSAFQDLQAAYEMRLVTAKDFFKVMEKPSNCPQLRKDLKKLHASAVSTFPRAKSATRLDSGMGSNSSGPSAESHGGEENSLDSFGFPPPPAPSGEPEFGDDFNDFR